jgi:hypothetical protein
MQTTIIGIDLPRLVPTAHTEIYDVPAARDYTYLLHFSSRISPNHTCQHYAGHAHNLSHRIQVQRRGRRWRKRNGQWCGAARLLEVARQRGIGFQVAKVWVGAGRDFEKRLKGRKQGPDLCPICKQLRKQDDLL